MSESLSDWLPELPASWRTRPFYAVMRERSQLNTGLSEANVLSLSYGQVVARDVDGNHGLLPASFDSYNIVEPNDIVMRLTDMQNDQRSLRTGQVRDRGIITSAYVTVTPGSDLRPRFAHYLLHGYDLAKVFYRMGGGLRQTMKYADLRRLPVLIPPTGEQDSIADFLDVQTARIDALIAEKDHLLELLAEQRLSFAEGVLAQAGAAARAKLGFFVDLLPGNAFPSDEFSHDPNDVPLLRGVNVSPTGVRWEDVVYWKRDHEPALERFKLVQGDVVFGMDRPWISTGARVAMIDDQSEGSLLLQRVCRLRANGMLLQRFIFFALSSDEFRQSVEVDLSGVSVPHISPEQVLRFKVPLLSLQQQKSRCDAADSAMGRIGQLERQTLEMLDRLHEYRSSLISAAVTGQLDLGAFKAAA